MDQSTLIMALFGISALAAIGFAVWQLKRVNDAKKKSG